LSIKQLIWSARYLPCQIEVFDFIRKRNGALRKLLAEVETDEDPAFDNEDNGLEDVFDEEEIFSDHESFCEHDKESKEKGDSENEDVNNLELFSSKEGTEWRKRKFRQNIRCHNIVSRVPGTKVPAKDKPCEELRVIHQR
ncbi:hypothetical protein AVEN_154336-1, partial [Araneus ventricosus]